MSSELKQAKNNTKSQQKQTDEVNESVVDRSTYALETPVPETRREKFFRFMDCFGDLFFLNLALVVSCIPIITIGAAFTAMYSVTLKMVRNEEGGAFKDYWKAFAKNFIPATKVWGLLLVFFGIMYTEYIFMLRSSGTAANALIVLIGVEMLFLSFTIPLLFPLVARYENTTLNYIKNSFILSISRLGVWFRVFFAWVGPALLTLAKPQVLLYAWYVWVFLLCGVLAYSCSLVIRDLFDELEEAQNQPAEKTQKTEETKETEEKRSRAGSIAKRATMTAASADTSAEASNDKSDDKSNDKRDNKSNNGGTE